MPFPHSSTYEKYIRSAQWRKIAAKMKEYVGFTCQRCGNVFHGNELEVHHLNYERLGRERPSDLQVLCRRTCHPIADAHRTQRTSERSAERRSHRAQDAFLSKKYGDNYSSYADQGMYEEAERWLENRRYGENGDA